MDQLTIADFPQRGSSVVDNFHLVFLFPCLAPSRGSRAIVQASYRQLLSFAAVGESNNLEVYIRQEGPISSFSPTGSSSSTKTLLPGVVLSYAQTSFVETLLKYHTTAALLSLTPPPPPIHIQNPCALAALDIRSLGVHRRRRQWTGPYGSSAASKYSLA